MIFYFTGTGNSLYAAQRLGTVFGENLVNITEAVKRDECSYELEPGEMAGFVFPVYFYGIPVIVDDFIRKLSLHGRGEPYIYAVLTCGGSILGADRMFFNKLGRRGYKVAGSFSLVMPDNYLLLYSPAPLNQQNRILTAADERLEQIGEFIRDRNGKAVSSGVLAGAGSRFMYLFYRYGRRTKKFYADSDCTGCGLCEIICPVRAIELKEGKGMKKPEWTKERCVHCLACINRCPAAAIQYGRGTGKRRRYMNPILRRNKSTPDQAK